jgi:hypothetical protein
MDPNPGSVNPDPKTMLKSLGAKAESITSWGGEEGFEKSKLKTTGPELAQSVRDLNYNSHANVLFSVRTRIKYCGSEGMEKKS